MPTCHKCKNSFPNWAKINGALKNLKSRKYCLGCSPHGLHNTRKLSDEVVVPEGYKFCRGPCQRVLPVNSFYVITGTRRFSYCMECDRIRNNKKHTAFKQKAVEHKGGRCVGCGYARCIAALDFHHLDPSKKDLRLSGRTELTKEVLEELDKCVLLCATCHREVHAGVRSLSQV